MRLALIGCGHMGGSLVRALLKQGLVQLPELAIVERGTDDRESFRRELNCRVENNVADLADFNPDIVVLAVKPVDRDVALEQLRPLLANGPLLISVLAGCTVQSLSGPLGGYSRIARAMPNLPVQVGTGATVIYAPDTINHQERALIGRIFASMGLALFVDSEALVDAGTALAGSGPAYIYRLMEAMITAGESIGFTAEESAALVHQTVHGAVALFNERNVPAPELRRAVTSPNGTTAAALEALERREFDNVVCEAIQAAYRRAREIADGK